jgi:class 3 adenylate cyclase
LRRFFYKLYIPVESASNQQLLKRIASLVSENKDLKKKHREISEAYNQIVGEVESYRELIEKTQSEKNDTDGQIYKQKRFETVTVMYIEIMRLSDEGNITENTVEYIDKFDGFVFRFNEIAQKYDLVKLHSLGDHFVCAGGIPEKNSINPITVTLAAIEILEIIEADNLTDENAVWSLHIGIHTGAVTAFVGEQTGISYELKGDTINETSRIVSVGKKNKVIISASTYDLVKELFDCTYFNTLSTKYRNKQHLYNVTGLKKEFADDEKRHTPNNTFRIQLMLIQFGDLQEMILNRLEKELPEHLYYHNVKHTVDVVTQSELIGWAEGLDDHQLMLLKTAALFHDTGHIISYQDHEDHSTEIAREILPKYSYLPEEIEVICRLIMATKLPPKPADLLESIICDSDLDYLGRTDFVPVSNSLFAELKVMNDALTLDEWNKMQVKFISSHQYFTKTGRKLRNVNKQVQIERIKQLII